MLNFAIIPVKNLDVTKSRLSPLLSSSERGCFVLKMLEDVLKATKSTPQIRQTVVVGADSETVKVAKSFGAVSLAEVPLGLNEAIFEAVKWCAQKGAESALILPADIPLVTPTDLNEILSLGKENALVISPSRDGEGTNALLLKPPNCIKLFYGLRSFQRHVKEASMRKLRFCTFESPRIGLDVDTVEDLLAFVQSKAEETSAYKFLKRVGVLERLGKA